MADTNDKRALERLLDEIVDCAVSVGKSDAMKGFGAFTEIDSISMTAMRRSISQKRAQILGHFNATATPPADAALAENAAIECLRACAQAMRIFDRPDTAAEVDRATDAIAAALRALAVPDGIIDVYQTFIYDAGRQMYTPLVKVYFEPGKNVAQTWVARDAFAKQVRAMLTASKEAK